VSRRACPAGTGPAACDIKFESGPAWLWALVKGKELAVSQGTAEAVGKNAMIQGAFQISLDFFKHHLGSRK
jgi:hypothetical protein